MMRLWSSQSGVVGVYCPTGHNIICRFYEHARNACTTKEDGDKQLKCQRTYCPFRRCGPPFGAADKGAVLGAYSLFSDFTLWDIPATKNKKMGLEWRTMGKQVNGSSSSRGASAVASIRSSVGQVIRVVLVQFAQKLTEFTFCSGGYPYHLTILFMLQLVVHIDDRDANGPVLVT